MGEKTSKQERSSSPDPLEVKMTQEKAQQPLLKLPIGDSEKAQVYRKDSSPTTPIKSVSTEASLEPQLTDSCPGTPIPGKLLFKDETSSGSLDFTPKKEISPFSLETTPKRHRFDSSRKSSGDDDEMPGARLSRKGSSIIERTCEDFEIPTQERHLRIVFDVACVHHPIHGRALSARQILKAMSLVSEEEISEDLLPVFEQIVGKYLPPDSSHPGWWTFKEFRKFMKEQAMQQFDLAD